jgi:cellulose synthase/poly-beta-1,6-N-acetylglucosamine synthase-like glycosyltransferase
MSCVGWHVAVLIPARDEELLLPRCLRSVQLACLRLPQGITTDIVVVSDGSQDRTHAIAEELLQGTGTAVATNGHGVGSARACAATTALRRYNGSRRRCWLANTDADCEVPADWLLDQVALARRGFVAVAGIIDVDSFVEHELHVKDSFRRSYRIQSDGWHPHVHGANMGIRADAYLRAGGWASLLTAEDHDLWRRLESCGGRRLADATLQVLTSGRREGRAPLGFAAALAAHNGTAA